MKDNIGDITFAETFGGTDAALDLARKLSVAPRVDERKSVTFDFPHISHHLAVRRLFEVRILGYTNCSIETTNEVLRS